MRGVKRGGLPRGVSGRLERRSKKGVGMGNISRREDIRERRKEVKVRIGGRVGWIGWFCTILDLDTDHVLYGVFGIAPEKHFVVPCVLSIGIRSLGDSVI